MVPQTTQIGKVLFLPRGEFSRLIQTLRDLNYTVIAPSIVEGVVSFRPLVGDTIEPGWSDVQEPGKYRLVPGDPDMSFEHGLGADGIKRYLFPETQRLCAFHIEGDRFELDAAASTAPQLAFIGMRPCELEAMKLQDRVFGADDPATLRCEAEPFYTETRSNCFTVVVNCTRPGGNCFCSSIGAGPAATEGYDLALTELRGGFVITVGSERGGAVMRKLAARTPTSAELELAELKLARARDHMGRRLDASTLRQTLLRAIEDPAWDDIAKRCLSCGNCTMVCPSCFCSTVVDSTDLGGQHVERTRHWESCFTHQFSYTTAGPLRNTIRGRYRHWLRHKLCTWWDQFGCFGCVGCGRCITWCPAGIDITVEAERIGRLRAGSDSTAAAAQPAEVQAS